MTNKIEGLKFFKAFQEIAKSKENYKIDENELSKISKISDNISDKSLSIIKNIQDTIKNFNNFDISQRGCCKLIYWNGSKKISEITFQILG